MMMRTMFESEDESSITRTRVKVGSRVRELLRALDFDPTDRM